MDGPNTRLTALQLEIVERAWLFTADKDATFALLAPAVSAAI
jgi:hypothetical protein